MCCYDACLSSPVCCYDVWLSLPVCCLVLQADRSDDVCCLCMKQFRLFVRKLPCQRCQNYVCSNCYQHKIIIPPDTKRKALACDGCFGMSQEWQLYVANKYKI